MSPPSHPHIREIFHEQFGGRPEFLVRAPGRVNLIGEHTDYNGGFVLPIAIDRSVWIALWRRSDRRVRIHSREFETIAAFDLDEIERDLDGMQHDPDGIEHDPGDTGLTPGDIGHDPGDMGHDAGGIERDPGDIGHDPGDMGHREPGWAAYPQGVAWALLRDGIRLSGWDGVIAGDIPVGAGLSSSAALELAVACAFATLGNLDWDPAAMAQLARRVENEWIGVQSGIMDPLIIAAGEADKALLIDCRTLERTPVPLPDDAVIVVMDSRKSRELAASAYNTRRSECERAAHHFGLSDLRALDPKTLENASSLDETSLKRARHVVTENARTLEAARAMVEGDTVRLGRLIDESHDSLRDDFQVSSAELDALVEIARKQHGCFGARMTGAGFGGCAIALVERDAADEFASACAREYRAETGLHPQIYVCHASDGVRSWALPARYPG